jgi:hypothetical protein
MDKPGFAGLRRVQEDVDRASFFVDGRRYSGLAPIDIIRHDLFHLVKLVAKVADYCDKSEHDLAPDVAVLADEVIPDLLVYALQFANALDVDLDQAYARRVEFIAHKFPVAHEGSAQNR